MEGKATKTFGIAIVPTLDGNTLQTLYHYVNTHFLIFRDFITQVSVPSKKKKKKKKPTHNTECRVQTGSP